MASRKDAKKKTVSKASTTSKEKSSKKSPIKKSAAKSKTALRPSVAKSTSNKKAASDKPVSGAKSSKKKKKLTPRERVIQRIRQRLVDQKNALLEEAESAMNTLPEQTIFPDLGDQASAETDRNFMLRLKGREQRLLNKIEEALERINTDTYGICDFCGEPIHSERLEARPVTTLCIECKTEQEEEEKLLGS